VARARQAGASACSRSPAPTSRCMTSCSAWPSRCPTNRCTSRSATVRAEGLRGALFAPAELDGRKAIALLRPLLEDSRVRKDGHDLKRDLVAWADGHRAARALDIDARIRLVPARHPTGREFTRWRRRRGSAFSWRAAPAQGSCARRAARGRRRRRSPSSPSTRWVRRLARWSEGAACSPPRWRRTCAPIPSCGKLYSELELPLLEVLAGVELTGISLDVPRLEALNRELGTRSISCCARSPSWPARSSFPPPHQAARRDSSTRSCSLPVLKRGKRPGLRRIRRCWRTCTAAPDCPPRCSSTVR